MYPRDDESRIRSYYVDLVTRGLPFDALASAVYAPLRATDFKETLIELRFKGKTSPPMRGETQLKYDFVVWNEIQLLPVGR